MYNFREQSTNFRVLICRSGWQICQPWCNEKLISTQRNDTNGSSALIVLMSLGLRSELFLKDLRVVCHPFIRQQYKKTQDNNNFWDGIWAWDLSNTSVEQDVSIVVSLCII